MPEMNKGVQSGGNAARLPCEVLRRPKDLAYAEDIRQFQGCPTIAVTRSGRIYLGWYAGGVREPDMDNYNLLVYSDDGLTWSDPVLVIPSSRENRVHALDIQLWVSPDNRLYVYWVQNDAKPAPNILPSYPASQPAVCSGGFLFDDFVHAEWMICCEDPDAEEPEFSAPPVPVPGLSAEQTPCAAGRLLAPFQLQPAGRPVLLQHLVGSGPQLSPL